MQEDQSESAAEIQLKDDGSLNYGDQDAETERGLCNNLTSKVAEIE